MTDTKSTRNRAKSEPPTKQMEQLTIPHSSSDNNNNKTPEPVLLPVVTPNNLYISAITGYVPLITNNFTVPVMVTLKISCTVKGFSCPKHKNDNLSISCSTGPNTNNSNDNILLFSRSQSSLPLEGNTNNNNSSNSGSSDGSMKEITSNNNCCTFSPVSPTVSSPLAKKKKRSKSMKNVIPIHKTCHKLIQVIYKTIIILPNSKTILQPNTIQTGQQNKENNEEVIVTQDEIIYDISLVKQLNCSVHSKSKNIILNHKVKYDYQIVDYQFVKNSSLDEMKEEMKRKIKKQVELENYYFEKELHHYQQQQLNTSSTNNNLYSPIIEVTKNSEDIFSINNIYHQDDENIEEEYINYNKQKREEEYLNEMKTIIEIIDNKSDMDDIECYWNINELQLKLLFEPIRNISLINSKKDLIIGMSPFVFACVQRKYDLIEKLCKCQPHYLYDKILNRFDQMNLIMKLEDGRIVDLILISLKDFIDLQIERFKLSSHLNRQFKDEIEQETGLIFNNEKSIDKYYKRHIVNSFIHFDNIFVIGPLLRNEYSMKFIIDASVTMSKTQILKYLLDHDFIKPNDYIKGGTSLHWAVINRNQEVMKMLINGFKAKKGLRVNVEKEFNNSKLYPFNNMTAYQISLKLAEIDGINNVTPLNTEIQENANNSDVSEALHPNKTELFYGVCSLLLNKGKHLMGPKDRQL
ncbi:hypothetical protein ABK040_005769 [Willaertia magna]